MFDDWSDEDLVATILKGSGNGPGNGGDPHLTCLFWRYFDAFEKKIRAVLRTRDLDYTQGSACFNFIFEGIFERVFTPRNFRRIAVKFNPRRSPRFRTWFLGTVVPDRIRDWLRTRDPHLGMTNLEYLRLQCRGPERGQVPVTDERDPDPDPPSPVDRDPNHRKLEACVRGLPLGDRALAKLLFWGILPPEEEETRFLAEKRGIPHEQVLRELSAYANLMRERGAEERGMATRLEKVLGLNWSRREAFERQLYSKSREMRAFGFTETDFHRLREESEGLTLDKVGREAKALTRRSRGRTGRPEPVTRRLHELGFLEILLRERKAGRKIAELRKKRDRLYSTMDRPVREIIGVPPNRFSQRKRILLKKLRDCMRSAEH